MVLNKDKERNFSMNARKLLKEAQFHGLNKLDDSKCRCLWITSLFILLLASIAIASNLVIRFVDQPTFIARMERVDNKMEFPSVQICPEIGYPEYKIDEFLSGLQFPDHLNKSYMKSIIKQLGALYSPDISFTVREFKRIESFLDYNKIDAVWAAKTLTISCEETLLRCRLFGEIKNCRELFTLEMSEYGFCCIFNGRSLISEIKQYGIHKVFPRSMYFTSSIGFQSGLIVAVNQSVIPINVDLNYKWVLLDGGHSYIESTVNGTPLSPGTETWLIHHRQGFHIDEDAVSLNTELRGCRLTSEPLTLFPIYHKRKYCQLECEIYHLIKVCGCAMMGHPLPPKTPICRGRSLPCARQELARFNRGACPCLSTCDVDTDISEIASFRLIQHYSSWDSFYHGLDFSKTSVVRVFIAKRLTKTKSRIAYYNFHDLFSQLGGIFNVFFGCSLLSILEIIQIIKYACQGGKNPSKYLKNKEQYKRKKVDVKNSLKKSKRKTEKTVRFHK